MLESAGLPRRIGKKAYKEEEPRLWEALLDTQFELIQQATTSLVVLMAGVDGAGKADVAHRLFRWLDAHYMTTHAFDAPTAEERARPRLWRYWRALPRYGRIALHFGSWYHEPLAAHLAGERGDDAFAAELQRIAALESALVADRTIVVKFWLHLDRDTHAARLRKARKGKGPIKSLYEEWGELADESFERLVAAGSRMLELTSTADAPWIVVPSHDRRWRDLAIGRVLEQTLRRQSETAAQTAPDPPVDTTLPAAERGALARLDFDRRLKRSSYEEELEALQRRLRRLSDHARFTEHGVVAAFEGNDAAGKGGTILRAIQALDPRRFQVLQVKAPSEEEKAHPWLWRFWRDLPRHGDFAFFDRSWYGRVLVERVEGFCTPADWMRAYGEINEFEHQLAEAGFVVAKFWLAIGKDEQLKRFEAREQVAHKRFKLTPDDWRNRERWADYERAAEDMLDRTGTAQAPWTVVEAEDKRHARIKVLRTLCERIEAAI